jgi:O-antigen ligase
LAVLVLISFPVARANGVPIENWVRDVAAYALFAAVAIFALDGQMSTPRKLLVAMLVVAGLLGGLSWAVEWLHRREILDLPFARLVFPSAQLPGLLYLFAMATALTADRRRLVWATLAGLTLGLFLLTGTRSSLLLLIGPVAMVAIVGWGQVRSSAQIIVLHAIAAGALVVAFQIALAIPAALEQRSPSEPGSAEPAATSIPDVLGDRFGSLPTVLGNVGGDASIRERVAQYKAAWRLFLSSPIVGVGPGHAIDWIDVSGYPRSGFAVDTPLVMPAKFGVFGVLVFLGIAVAYGSTVRTALLEDRRSAVTLTLVAFGILVTVGLPLGFPVEDKGTSLALMLLLSLALAESSERRVRMDQRGSAAATR